MVTRAQLWFRMAFWCQGGWRTGGSQLSRRLVHQSSTGSSSDKRPRPGSREHRCDTSLRDEGSTDVEKQRLPSSLTHILGAGARLERSFLLPSGTLQTVRCGISREFTQYKSHKGTCSVQGRPWRSNSSLPYCVLQMQPSWAAAWAGHLMHTTLKWGLEIKSPGHRQAKASHTACIRSKYSRVLVADPA